MFSKENRLGFFHLASMDSHRHMPGISEETKQQSGLIHFTHCAVLAGSGKDWHVINHHSA